MIGAGILTYPHGRIDIRSTVPVEGPMVTRSPVFIPFSKLDKYASDNVFDQVCAPTVAGFAPGARQRSGAMFAISEQDHHRDGASHHRQRVAKRRQQRSGARALGSGRP